MRKVTVLFAVIVLLAASGLLTAQTVDVTFRVNAATVPDTVGPNSVVQVRGNTAPLTWGGDTGGNLVNVGGDYWEVTLAMPANTSGIEYKFFANAVGDPNGNGWESNVSGSSGNRPLTTGAADTTLPLQFFNKVTGSGQFDWPFAQTDSLDTWIRVNVQTLVGNDEFDPGTQVMGIRGGTPNLSWGETLVLAPETPSDNAGQFTYLAENFWSGHVQFDSISVGQTIEYKFVIAEASNPTGVSVWEGTDNRTLIVPEGKADTTAHWVWWENEPPPIVPGGDSALVLFRADLSRAINENSFNIGDTLVVRYGLESTGEFATDTMTNEFLTNKYRSEVMVRGIELGSNVAYQYYLRKRGADFREIFFDFGDPNTSTQERRKVFIPPTPPVPVTVEDFIDNDTDPHRMPRFQNTAPISQNVLVTYECDLRCPYYQVLAGDTIQNIQGAPPFGWVYPGQQDSIFAWGVYLNGPGNGTPDWQGWDLINLAPYQMFDDGTHGDITPGDSIYAFQVLFSPDSSDLVGQEFKFGIGAGDNEGGSTGFGLNHFENIDDSQTEFTIHTQFGSINPPFYTICFPVGIEDPDELAIITSAELRQNYPNPFNPVTSIEFKLPKRMEVKLVIYDVLGRQVRKLLDGQQNPGGHKVYWNGTNDEGQFVGSGIYFYRLEAESFSATRKMMLLK
jgi:hypothetical protein